MAYILASLKNSKPNIMKNLLLTILIVFTVSIIGYSIIGTSSNVEYKK